jgi:hypothetical protein
VVRAPVEALFSPSGEIDPARLDAVANDAAAYLAFASRGMARAIAAGLDLVRLLPLLLLRHAALFDDLPLDARVRFVEALDRSRVPFFPLIVALYKTVLTMIFFEDAPTLAALGYPGGERVRFLRGAGARGDASAPASPPAP